jgi:hypothetical protein
MKNKKWIFLLLIINISTSFADGTYFIPGSLEYSKEFSEKSEGESKAYFIPDAVKQKMMELDEQQILWAFPQDDTSKMADSLNKQGIDPEDHFIMEPQKSDAKYLMPKNERKSSAEFDQHPQGSNELPKDKYVESDVFARLKDHRNKGESAFALTLFYDNNTYTDARGVYDKTFNGEGAEWYNNVFALLTSEFYILKSWFNFALGGNLGASYKAGYGVFAADGTTSDTRFTLLSIPLDASVILEFNLWDWVRVEASGGPSVLGLIQNRDDREDDEGDKIMGQVSLGYFAMARFKLSLGMIFPKTNKPMFDDNDVTNYFINFDVRYQDYRRFKQDDVEVSGISAGLGLTFEFM